MIDESELWPDGDFVTTHLVVGREYLAKFPTNIERLVNGLITALDWIATNDSEAMAAANAGIKEITSKELNPETIKRAWSNLSFTYDPIANSLEKCKDNAVAVGLLDPVDLDGIYELSPLNSVLKKRGLAEIGVV